MDDITIYTPYRLKKEWAAARFLFENDKDILDFLMKVLSTVEDLLAWSNVHGFPLETTSFSDNLDRLGDEQTKKIASLFKRLTDLRTEAIEVFKNYLTLKA